MATKKAARRRPDFQTDYEDPGDRLFRRSTGPKGGPPKKRDNPVATVAYYLGAVAMIPCVGSLLGPIAVLLGVIGLVQASAPNVAGKGRATSGLWFGIVATVLYVIGPIAFYIWALTWR